MTASPQEVTQAVAILRSGGVIGLPTETVYGLAADATQPDAVAKIFTIKGRPTGHPLILHLAGAEQLPTYVDTVTPAATKLAAAFWPGPLTLVLRRNPETVSDAVTGGLDTVAIRVPGHPLARQLLSELGRPVAAPSANRFGAVSPTTKEHVLADLGDDVPLVLDGGACDVGLESTIVDLTREEPRLLRPGGIVKAQLEEALGMAVLRDDGQSPAAPGTLESHYAPRAQVRLVAQEELWDIATAIQGEVDRLGVIALGPSPEDVDAEVVLVADAHQAAHDLYGALRSLDERGCSVILTALPPPEGIGVAVGDRLRRAAAPRS